MLTVVPALGMVTGITAGGQHSVEMVHDGLTRFNGSNAGYYLDIMV